MAARRLAGEAFTGEVTDVRTAYTEGKRPRPRPLVTLRTEDCPHLSESQAVHRLLPDGTPGRPPSSPARRGPAC